MDYHPVSTRHWSHTDINKIRINPEGEYVCLLHIFFFDPFKSLLKLNLKWMNISWSMRSFHYLFRWRRSAISLMHWSELSTFLVSVEWYEKWDGNCNILGLFLSHSVINCSTFTLYALLNSNICLDGIQPVSCNCLHRTALIFIIFMRWCH